MRAVPFDLRVPLSTGEVAVSTVRADSIEAVTTVDVTEPLARELAVGTSYSSLSQDVRAECTAVRQHVDSLADTVLSVLKYGLQQAHLDADFGPSHVEWRSPPDQTWRMLPYGTTTVLIDAEFPMDGDFDAAGVAQQLLDTGFQPFEALHHLHRARRDRDARAKWIDATIAAELAIKEFLVRRSPDLAALLLEVPSPPLHKLYGSILEHYAGQRSPRLRELQKGAEVRNKLLHRPGHEAPDLEQAARYVQDVQVAVLHLVSLLDPNDDVAEYFYRGALAKATRE